MVIKLLLMAVLCVSAINTHAAVDMFLKIDGVEGESQDSQHPKEIDILAWSWGASSDSRKVCIQDLNITKFIDSASPQMLMNQVTHTRYPKARLTVRRTGNRPTDYIVIELSDVWVSSLSTGGSDGEARLTENVTLNFEELIYTYTPQNLDGSSGAIISSTISNQQCK